MMTLPRKIYKDWYTQEYQIDYPQSIFGKARDEMTKFISYLDDNSHVIELGCGDGRNIQELLKQKFTVTGIDLIDEEILYAKLPKNTHITYLQKNILKYKFNVKQYNALICSEVLHMFSKEEIILTLDKVQSTVVRNGYIFIDILADLSRELTSSKEAFTWDIEAKLSIEDAKHILLDV